MDKITIKNRKGQKLSAIIHKSDKSKKIVIITHTFKGDKDYQPIMRNSSEAMCKEGYSVLRFDCYGSGESEGTFEQATVTSEVEDLEDVIKYAKDIGYKEICLIGFSMGAMISVLAYKEDIKCLVFWSPAFTLKRMHEDYREEMIKNGFIIRKRTITNEEVKVGKKMWKEFGSISLENNLDEIKCPVLVIYGSEDQGIRIGNIKEYYQKLKTNKQLEVIEGGDHDFLMKEAEKEAIKTTIKWLKNNF